MRAEHTESLWVLWRLGRLDPCGVGDLVLGMFERFEVGQWHVADGTVDAPRNPPVNPLRVQFSATFATGTWVRFCSPRSGASCQNGKSSAASGASSATLQDDRAGF